MGAGWGLTGQRPGQGGSITGTKGTEGQLELIKNKNPRTMGGVLLKLKTIFMLVYIVCDILIYKDRRAARGTG